MMYDFLESRFSLSKINRWQAFGIHLVISSVIFLVLLSIILFVWYPGPFIDAGGWQGIKIVVGVDMVMGPLLTLIVYKPGKKGLKGDLYLIAALQLGCLSWGVFAIHSQKPSVIVFSDEGLHTASYAELKDLEPPFKPSVHSAFLWGIPSYTVNLPEDPQERVILKGNAELFSSTPFFLTVENLLPIQTNLSYLESLLSNFEIVEGCQNLPIFNSHGDLETCFRFEQLEY